MKKWMFVMLFLLPSQLQAQIITTIAGTGSDVFSGEGVPATSAGIPAPTSGAFDKNGNFYFADELGVNRIQKINTLGIITTVAGNGMGGFNGDGISATAAKLNQPNAVKLDTFGNLYIADAANNRIRKVNISTGIITTIAGTGTGPFAGENVPATTANIYTPLDICFDKFGNLYIADVYNYRIRKVNTAGIITTFAGTGSVGASGDGGPATAAELNFPSGVAADDTGNIFIADRNTGLVRKVNLSGIITTVAGNGTLSYIGDGMPATNAQFSPFKIAIDSANQLFIDDNINHRVYKVDGAGIIHKIAGTGVAGDYGDGGPATAAALNYPSGLSFDPCGNLYITTTALATISADTGRCIRKVTFNPTCHIDSVALRTTGTNETAKILVYPNPANDILHIEGLQRKNTYHLLNVIGSTVLQGLLKEGNNSIIIQSLSPGMYMLELTDEERNKTITKIIKQ